MELLLSYFDNIRGPRFVVSLPKETSDKEYSWIPSLLDIYNNNTFFEHVNAENRNLRFINYTFNVPSDWARGGVEKLLLTAIIERKMDLKMLEHRFKEFANKLRDEPDIFKGLYRGVKKDAAIEESYVKILSIMEELYHVLQLKLEQLHLIDVIFTQNPINKNSPVSRVYRSIVNTFITTLDARTTEGALILHNVGTRFARNISSIFIENNIDLLLEELTRFWKKNSFGEISNVQVTQDSITFDIAHCCECSNLPNMGHTLCKFHEGFFTTIFQEKIDKDFLVKELDCLGKGTDHCSFEARRGSQ